MLYIATLTLTLRSHAPDNGKGHGIDQSDDRYGDLQGNGDGAHSHGLGAYKDTGACRLGVAFVILICITGMEYAVGFLGGSTALIAEASLALLRPPPWPPSPSHPSLSHIARVRQATHMFLDTGGIGLALIALYVAKMRPGLAPR